MPRTQHTLPVLRLSIWKRDGKLYFVEKDDFLSAIINGGKSEEEIKREMQFGFHHIQDLLDGKRIDVWSASFVEYGILRLSYIPNTPSKF